MAFDPDAFLAQSAAPAFDPDAFLAAKSGFDPDAFLANVPTLAPQVVTPDQPAQQPAQLAQLSPEEMSRTGMVYAEPSAVTAGIEPTKISEAIRSNVEPMLEHPVQSFAGMFTNWDDLKHLYQNPQDILGPVAKQALGMPVSPEEEPFSQQWYNTAVMAGMAGMGMRGGESVADAIRAKEPELIQQALSNPEDIQKAQSVQPPPITHVSPETGFEFQIDPTTGEAILPPKPDEFVPQQEPRQLDTAVEQSAGQQQAVPEPTPGLATAQAPETGLGQRSDTGISTQNAYTDAAREEANLPPRIEQAAAEDFGQQTWDASAERLGQDPGAGQRLVENINNGKVRAIDEGDNALLLREQIKARIEHSDAVDAKNEADASGDPNAIDEAGSRLEQARENYQNVLDADAKAGTALSHGFSARKMIANEDYSLARMEATARAAKGKPLDADQFKYVQDLQKRIETLENQANQYTAGKARPRAERMQIKNDAIAARRNGQSIEDFLSEKADAARTRIKQMMDEGVNCL